MNSINLRAPLAALALVVLAACENPVKPAEHEDPAGLVLRAGTTEVVRVVGLGLNGTATGVLAVTESGQTPVLTVALIDDHGDELTLDEETALGVESDAPATATWQGTAAGAYTGRVAGHAAGTATLKFRLYHGSVDTGHVDAEFWVPVTVTAVQP
ncbi:MAG TPA: hypothetical protein VFZ24_05685 [Longimicrobiales bacterium]